MLGLYRKVSLKSTKWLTRGRIYDKLNRVVRGLRYVLTLLKIVKHIYYKVITTVLISRVLVNSLKLEGGSCSGLDMAG